MRSIFVLLLAAASVAWAAYWMEDIRHQGIAPFNPSHDYTVFRNVKHYGAKGDGGMVIVRSGRGLLFSDSGLSYR